MELIQMLLAAIILGIIYKKMLKWEVGASIGKKQALLPIGLGVLSTILAVPVLIHTIYDALTVYNPAIAAVGMDDESMAFWIIMGLIVIIKGMKREAPRLSEMLLTK